MAKNVHVPSSLPQLSENHTMGDSSNNAIPIFESSAVNVGSNNYHLSFDNIDDHKKKLSQISSLSLSSLSLSLPPINVLNEQVQPQRQPQPAAAVVSLDIDKRPVGRPLGSKNKPKPAMEFPIFLRKKKDFLKPIILIVPGGTDIVSAITKFAHNQNGSISVLHASGLISEVNLVNPICPSHDLTVQGNMHMLSLSGFYTNNLSPSVPDDDIICSPFTIQFSNARTFQLFGGLVGRKLIAAESVQVLAFVTKKHKYHKMVHPIPPPPPSDVEEYMDQLMKFVQANSK